MNYLAKLRKTMAARTDMDRFYDPASATVGLVRDTGRQVRKASQKIVNGLATPKNWWHLATLMLTTGLATFTIFTVSTLVRGLYGDSWIGAVSIGAIFGVMTMLASAFSKGGLMPIFDIVGIIINMSIFNMEVSSRKKGHKSKRAKLHLIPAIFLLITLLGAGFASAGISRAILGEAAYSGAAKVPNPAYAHDKAFFIEYFAMTIFYMFIQQMVLVGARIEFVAILSGFYWTAMQAIGYDISSASYNFVYWLTVNTIGFTANFWVGWWVYLVSALATAGTVLFLNKLLFWLYNAAIRQDLSKESDD